MSTLQAAKAATRWRAAPFDEHAQFTGAPGIFVVMRNDSGEERLALFGMWPRAFETFTIAGDRVFRSALQLYERTWLYAEKP